MSQALVVEDLRLFREALAFMLEEQTDLKKTIQTGSLAEARRVWEHLCGDFDLAIVDLDLTNGDGISLIENIRELPLTFRCWRSPAPEAWSNAPGLCGWGRTR